MRLSFSSLLLGSLFLVSSTALADVQHTVGKGHTIEAIAHRYKVSVKSIIEANHLKDTKHLQVGEILTIPKVDAPAKTKGGDSKEKDASKKEAKDAKAKVAKGALGASGSGAHTAAEPTTYAAKPKTPGVVHIKRLGMSDEADLKVLDHHGKVAVATSKSFEKLMRSVGGLTHPIEPRLIQMVGVVSNHFGSRKLEIVSGFRPYTPTQYTPHSNHNHGKAIDFRVVGVPNEAVRDFCRTLKNVGCGYYPNSTFVHMDVRDKEAFWIDYSKPGEPPHYNAPNVDADEGTSDVHDHNGTSNTAPDTTAPAAPTTATEESPSEAPAKPAEPSPTSDQ